jgi:hypothetical protein
MDWMDVTGSGAMLNSVVPTSFVALTRSSRNVPEFSD